MKNIEFVNENEILVDGIRFRKDEPPNPPLKCGDPEFKVGQWALWEETDEVFYINRVDARGHLRANFSEHKVEQFINKTECCLATPQEIESHLREICDEKYIGKKVKCLDRGIYTVDSFWQYRFDEDALCYYTINGGGDGIWLYKQGKFAEIIPDKKKLPKTKEELKSVLNELADICEYGIMNTFRDSVLNEILEDYEN